MPFIKNLFIIIGLLLIANIITAQSIVQSADQKLSGDVPYVIVGKIKTNTIICMQIDELYEVKKYNDNMGEWSTIEVPSIPKDCKQLLFIKQDTTYIALYEIKSARSLVYYTQLFDTNFRQLAPALNIASVDIDKNSTGITMVQSENKKRVALYYINKIDDVGYANYAILDANTKNVRWQKIMIEDMDVPIRMHTEILNIDHCLITIETLNKDELIESMKLYIAKNNEPAKQITLDFKTELYNYKSMQVDNSKQALQLILTHAKTNSNDNNIVKKIEVNCATLQLIKNTDIVINNVANKNNDISSFANYLPRHILLKSNGDIILVSEYFNVEEVILGTDINATGNTGAPFRISRKMKKYDYSDVLFTAINNMDSIDWQKIVHKEQLSENDEGMYSSFGLVKLKNKIGIVFNAIDNNNTIQQATIDGDALVRYAILNDNKIEAKNMVFKQSKQISNNEIIVPSIRQNIYSFVKIRL